MNEQQQTPPSTPTPAKSNSKQYFSIALVLILLGMGIAMFYKSCSPKVSPTDSIANTDNSDIIDENQPEDKTLNDIIDKQDIDYDDDEEDPKTAGTDESTTPTPVNDVTNTVSPQPSHDVITINPDESNTDYKKYMVIAGSFGSVENARNRLEKTIILGFQDAEIVQFDHSKYHTVCAYRTNSETQAKAIAKKLINKKIEAFVHIQRKGK